MKTAVYVWLFALREGPYMLGRAEPAVSISKLELWWVVQTRVATYPLRVLIVRIEKCESRHDGYGPRCDVEGGVSPARRCSKGGGGLKS